MVSVLSGSAAFLLAVPAFAGQQRIWTGGGNVNIRNGPNWSPNGTPAFSAADADWLVFNGAGTPAQLAGTSAIALSVAANEADGYVAKSITVNNSSTNTYGTYVFTGSQTLILGDSTAVSANTGYLTNNTAGLQTFNLSGTNIRTYNVGFRSGGIDAAAGGFLFGNGTITSVGNQLNAAVNNMTVKGAFDTTINGVLVGTGTDVSAGGELIKSGTGTLTLNGNSTTWDGRVTVSGGVLLAGANAALGTAVGRTTITGGADSGQVRFQESATTGSLSVAENFYLAGRTAGSTAAHIGNLNGNNTLTGQIHLEAGGSEFGFSSTAGTLNVQGPIIVGAGVVAPNLRLSGGGDGVIGAELGADLGVTKEGAGTWTLGGTNNTFGGAITINEGRLNVSTSTTGGGNGSISVANGAALGVTLTGGNTSLHTSGLTLGGGTTLAFDLGSFAGVGNAYIVAGGLTLNGTGNTITIGRNNLNTIIGQQITLIDYGSGVAGAGFTLGTLPARVAASLNTSTAGKVYLTVTGFDYPRWLGSDTGIWSSDPASLDWQEVISGFDTHFIQGDNVIFDDPGVGAVILEGVLTPSAVTVNASQDYTFGGEGKLSGATGLIKQGAGTLILENGIIGDVFNDYTGTTRIEGGILQVGNYAETGQLGSGNVVIESGASLVFARQDNVELGNDLSGSGVLRKLYSATTLTLSGNNAGFTGSIEVGEGTVKLNGIYAASGVTSVEVEDFATFDLNGQSLFGAGQTVSVIGEGDSAGALINSGAGGVAVGVRSLVLNGSATIGGTGNFYVQGELKGNGHVLSKRGGNTAFLSNLGEINVSSLDIGAGRITLIGNTALNADPGVITLNGGELGLDNSTVAMAKNIVMTDVGGLITATAGIANTITGNITLGIGANTFQGAGLLTINGSISHVFIADGNPKPVLTKSGAGILILNGSNTYEGGTNITAGTLVFGTPLSVPGTAAITSATGTTIGFGFDFDQGYLDSKVPLVGNSASVALGVSTSNNYDLRARGATASLGAYTDVTYSGTLVLNGPTGAQTAYQFGGGGGTLTVTSVLSGANSVNIGAGGSASTVVLAAANTYTLGTTISTGTLRLGNAAALGAATNPLTITTATTTGTLDLNGYNLTVGSLASGANTALITDHSTAPGTTVLTVNIPTGSSTYQGSINNGANGRVISLVKDGAGTLTINKANGSNYTGDTIIKAGKLDVKINNAQALPAASKLVFEGTGIFSAATNSAAIGSLTLAGLAFNAGEGTVENFRQNANAIGGVLTFSTAPTRTGGATGNFVLSGTTDQALYKIVITAGATGGQSLNGGIYFGGSSFAAYAAEGYVRALDYAVDSNGLNAPAGTTLGAALNRDVQLTGTVTDQGAEILRTLRISGAYDLALTSGATLTLSTGGLIKVGGNAATISGGSGLTTGGGDLVVNSAAASDTLTIGTAITAGTNGLTKTGLGTLILSGANAYAGDSLVNGGTLHFANLPAFSNTTPGSKVRLNTASTVGFAFDFDQSFLAQHVVVPAVGSAGIALGVDSAQSYDFSATGLNYAGVSLGAVGNVTYTGLLTPNGTTYRLGGGGGRLNYGQQITGANSLTINGGGLSGTVYLSGANTHSGTTAVEGGTLILGHAAALGTSKVTVTAGTLDLNGIDVALRNLSGGATGLVTDNSVGSTANVRVNVISGTQSYAGGIANGAGGRVVTLIKEGAGNLIINKANGFIYTGDTIISGGMLRVRSHNLQVLPAQSNLIFNGTGTFSNANNAAASGTVAGALTLAGVAFNVGQGTIDSIDEGATTGSALGTTLTFTNAPTRARGAVGNFTIAAATNASVYKVAITNAPATGTAFNGGIYFGGSNFAAYDATGFVRALVYSGTPDTNTVNVAASQVTLGEVVPVNGKDVQLSAASISGQTDETMHSLKLSGASSIALADGATLTVTTGGLLKAGTGASTISGGAGVTTGGTSDLVVRTDVATDSLMINSAILASTTGGLTKAGAGKLSLAGANTFTGGVWVNAGTLELTTTGSVAQTGAVNVNAGTLIVSGSLSGVAELNVKNGSTLSGIGTIAGEALHVSLAVGGSIARGAPATNASGKLTLDLGVTGHLDLTTASLGGTGYLKFELGASSDQVALASGALNLGSGTFGLNDFAFTTRAGFGVGTYVLFDTASAIAGGFDLSNITGTLGAFDTTLGFSADGQAVVLTVAVPEPGAAVSLLGGLAMLVGLQRFRRQAAVRIS